MAVSRRGLRVRRGSPARAPHLPPAPERRAGLDDTTPSWRPGAMAVVLTVLALGYVLWVAWQVGRG